MPETLRRYEFRKGPPDRYPWDQWLDGKIHRLTRGREKDFAVSVKAFQSAAHWAAGARGLRVRTQSEGKGVVVLQSFKADQPPKGE